MSAADAVLYQQDRFPVFQNRMYASAQAAMDCPTGDIQLIQDARTGLVRNAAFQPEKVVYDAAYQNEQGHSGVFDAHMERIATLIVERVGARRLIEVGCGKGLFLQKLRRLGAEVTGFDPAYEGADPAIKAVAFDAQSALRADGLILRHVLEHMADPVSFLGDLAAANGGDGLIYIEVPCFDWILSHRAWFDIFYEHVNYFRLSDFHRIFGQVLFAKHSFGGQYLSVIAKLSSLRAPAPDPADVVAMPPRFLPDFGRTVGSAGAGPVVWGGASKGVIFSLVSQRNGVSVAHVIDINPAKQGLHLPGVGLKVEAPADILPHLPFGAEIVVMNPNYMDEIRALGGPGFQYRSVHDF